MTRTESAEVARLRKELNDAMEAERNQGLVELSAIPVAYDWRVTWKSEHVFHVTRSLSPVTVAAFRDWREKFPRASYPVTFEQGGTRVEGMDYLLIDGWLAHAGGGTLVLRGAENAKDAFDQEPRKLTQEECQDLVNCVVPDSLKRRL